MRRRFNGYRFRSIKDYSLSRPRLCNGRTQRTIAAFYIVRPVSPNYHRRTSKCDDNDVLIIDNVRLGGEIMEQRCYYVLHISY